MLDLNNTKYMYYYKDVTFIDSKVDLLNEKL